MKPLFVFVLGLLFLSGVAQRFEIRQISRQRDVALKGWQEAIETSTRSQEVCRNAQALAMRWKALVEATNWSVTIAEPDPGKPEDGVAGGVLIGGQLYFWAGTNGILHGVTFRKEP